MCLDPEEAKLMSFYLSNRVTKPTGVEPTEFLDLPPMAEDEAGALAAAAPSADSTEPDDTAIGPSTGPADSSPGDDPRDPA